MRVSIGGAFFEIESFGFGAHEASATAAIRYLEQLMASRGPRELNDPALLDQLAEQAAHHGTSTWRCWKPGYGGDLPTLVVKRTST
jgi:hypothetical protein